MNLKKMTIATLVFLLLAFQLDAARQGMRQRDGMGRSHDGQLMMRLLENRAEALGLSEQQLQEIRSLCTANAEQKVALVNKNNLLKLELDKSLAQENRDYAKIKDLMSQMAGNRIELRLNGLKTREKATAILTPEQRKALEEIVSERRREQRQMRSGKRDRMHRSDRSGRNRD